MGAGVRVFSGTNTCHLSPLFPSAFAYVKAILSPHNSILQYQANPAARDLREAFGGVAVFSPERG